MQEPEIVSYARQFIKDFPPQEYKDSLARAFGDRRADFIILDDNYRGQNFLAAAVAWAIDQGFLHNDRNEFCPQRMISSFRLTEKGKKEIISRS